MDMSPADMSPGPDAPPATAMQIRTLGKSFGPVEVLKSIDVEMRQGDFLVLVGPSGCGKSTLLNCIAGLEEVSTGQIFIAGRDVTQEPPRDRDIAMVFQSYALYPTMSVAENIGFGMKIRRIARDRIAARVGEVAELLQISHLLDRRPGQLSGGQRQRVAMGRALVRDPALFLFDEPLSNLDAKLRVEMRAEIKRLHETTAASIVYVTHDQVEAMTLATRIVVLKDGEIQQVGTPEEIYDRPANTFVADFIGSPPMNLVPATVQGASRLDFGDGHRLDLPTPLDALRDRARVVVGIRPEDMVLGRDGAVEVLPSLIEMTGADSYVSFALGGVTVTARTPGRFAGARGAPIGFRADADRLSFFDADSGLRI